MEKGQGKVEKRPREDQEGRVMMSLLSLATETVDQDQGSRNCSFGELVEIWDALQQLGA